ncbi:hypothetical protein PGT21_001936 [Puccinia graminis f. sp. tritici]|nr:hypothetical protein PGT21_001936 [Puccinia graminis f. sp. tritici]KAA1090233.1 hypothetical protein PGTUg99_037359 [Puccinia graminis f. sp. tritici]
MDPLTHDSLPPFSHSVAHSSVAYPNSIDCTSDYPEEYRKSSGVANPKIDMGEYYLPMNGVNTPYHRAQLQFPVAPASYRPTHPFLGDKTGKHQNPRPKSSSSLESDLKSQDERELMNAPPSAYPFEYGYPNVAHFRPYASTTSSENEVQPYQEAPERRPSTIENRSGSSGVQELALPPISNQLSPDSRYSADEPPIRQEEYAENLVKAGVEKTELSESEHSPKPKSKTGKKPSSLKVSEKRRQQNRAAQRAMRERRKRAAQHQEIHMTAIVAENAMLRERVNYLSNLLISHAINPGAYPSWSPVPAQENSPPMLPMVNTGNFPARSAHVADHNSASSNAVVPSHSVFPPAGPACSSDFPSAPGSVLNYYPCFQE